MQRFLSKEDAHLGVYPVGQDEDKKQKIGWINSRLCAPAEIKQWSDIKRLLLNHEFYRLMMLLVWLVFGGLVEIFMAQWGDMRYYQMPATQKHALLDLFHDAFPKIENFQIVNYFLTSCVAYTVLGFAIQSPNWSTRLTLLRRWVFLLGLLYIFRGITLLVTTLPSSLVDQCRPPEIEIKGTIAERFGFIYSVVAGTAFGCTDNIFSGHTSVMMSCVIIWSVHSRLGRVFSWILYSIASVGIFLIIISRFHYTIDVLLAIFITCMTWHVYLYYVREATVRLMFGFNQPASLGVFDMSIADGTQTYQYLAWQPHQLGCDWIMKICILVDGLDIRLRSMNILNEQGERRLTAKQMSI